MGETSLRQLQTSSASGDGLREVTLAWRRRIDELADTCKLTDPNLTRDLQRHLVELQRRDQADHAFRNALGAAKR